MPRKVIIDTDPGIDDAVAVILALFDPTLEVVALTATGGNVFPNQATRNVQTIVEQLDPPRWPRIGAAPEDNPLPADGRLLHGQNGLGNVEFPFAGLANSHPAEKVLCDEVRSAPEEITVLCLGPLTNIARAMQRNSEFCSLVGRLVIAGSTINTPGRVTRRGRFQLLLRSTIRPPRHQVVRHQNLNPARRQQRADLQLRLPLAIARRINPRRQIPAANSPVRLPAQRQVLAQEHITLHDVASLVAVTNPELFETEMLSGDVETEGELTSGMVVFDRRKASIREGRPNIDVALKADITAMRDCVLRSLENAGKAS